jgi:hypothetical protein
MITLYVCLYCFGFSLPIQKIIEVIGWQIFQNQRYGNLFVGLLYLIFTYKFYKIFNFTHEVSFGRWFGATFIVGSIAGISSAIFQGIISFIPIGLIFFND